MGEKKQNTKKLKYQLNLKKNSYNAFCRL